MSKIVRAIGALVGEIVQIKWTNPAGEVLYERITAPPADTWKARLLEQEERNGRPGTKPEPEADPGTAQP